MPDHRGPPRDRKQALIAPFSIGLAVVAVLAAVWLLRGRSPGPPPAPEPAASSAPPPAAAPAPAPPPVDRADLVRNANDAAAAFAAGMAPPRTKDSLIGRSFTLSIPFGCEGPQTSANPGSQSWVEYDPQVKSLHLQARASDWMTLPQVQAIPRAAQLEAAEGFWVPRPWSYSDACPRQASAAPPASPTPSPAPTLGLVRLFEKGGSRVLERGGRPYEFVRKLDPADPSMLTHAYRLVLEGRLTGWGDGRVAHCAAESVDHRPVCLYAVEFDRIAFLDGADGKLLAEWRE